MELKPKGNLVCFAKGQSITNFIRNERNFRDQICKMLHELSIRMFVTTYFIAMISLTLKCDISVLSEISINLIMKNKGEFFS